MSGSQKITHPIPGKVQVSIDFPNKFYMGSFAREPKFKARTENDEILVKLSQSSRQNRAVEIHLHHYLLSDTLSAWADSLTETPHMKADHKTEQLDVPKHLKKTVRKTKPSKLALSSK